MDNIIGQHSARKKLEIYAKSFSRTNRLPFILLSGCRGAGKTRIAREFHKTLKDQNGDRPPLIEINGSSLKKIQDFYGQVVPEWKRLGAILYIDEFHAISDEIKENFLTLLDVNDNPVRRVSVPDKDLGMVEHEIDFTKVSFMCGTTDQQKLGDPLLDRLTQVSLEPYNEEELLQILAQNYKFEYCSSLKDHIKSVLAGHPRDAVKKAEDLNKFCEALGIGRINKEEWRDFCEIMGVNPYGLTQSEIQIIRVLGERGACSLNALSATTGFSRKVIQSVYEKTLLLKDLIEIDGKRKLKPKGVVLYNSHFLKK